MTAKPNYNPFSSVTTSHPSSRTSTPGPSLISSKPAQVPHTSLSPQPPQSDPFAILASPPAQRASPMTNAPSSNLTRPSPSASIFNFAPSPQPTKSSSQSSGPPQQSNGASADDDWDFASALPDDNTQLPPANYFTLSRTSVTISFKISRRSEGDPVVIILAEFSNNTDALITEYTFQVAIKVKRITRLPIISDQYSFFFYIGLNAPTQSSVWAYTPTPSGRWNHANHRDQRRPQGTGKLGQDAVESVIQHEGPGASGAGGGSGVGDPLMPTVELMDSSVLSRSWYKTSYRNVTRDEI